MTVALAKVLQTGKQTDPHLGPTRIPVGTMHRLLQGRESSAVNLPPGGWLGSERWHHTEGLVSRDEAHCSAAAVARSASAGGSPCAGAFAGSPRLPCGCSLQGHTLPAQFQLHIEAGQCPLDTSPSLARCSGASCCSMLSGGLWREARASTRTVAAPQSHLLLLFKTSDLPTSFKAPDQSRSLSPLP